MDSVKVSAFPFPEDPPFTNPNEAAPEVIVENPAPAFSAVPAKEVIWLLVVAVVQEEDPFVPFAYNAAVPAWVPKFDSIAVGVLGAAAIAVPPFVAV